MGSPEIPFFLPFADYFTTNDHSLNLVGTLIDLGYLNISHHALNGKLFAVAVSTHELYAIGTYFHGGISGKLLTHGSLSIMRQSIILPARARSQLVGSIKAVAISATVNCTLIGSQGSTKLLRFPVPLMVNSGSFTNTQALGPDGDGRRPIVP